MFETLHSTIELLNSLSPIGVIGLLAYIVYLMISKKGPIQVISNNHLSGLPEMNATLLRIESTISEVRDGINYLRGRIQ